MREVCSAWHQARDRYKYAKRTFRTLERQMAAAGDDDQVRALVSHAEKILEEAKTHKSRLQVERRNGKKRVARRDAPPRAKPRDGVTAKAVRKLRVRTALAPLVRLASSIRVRERRHGYGPPSFIDEASVRDVLEAYNYTCALSGYSAAADGIKCTLVKKVNGLPLTRDNAVCVAASGPKIKSMSLESWAWPPVALARIGVAEVNIMGGRDKIID